VGSADAGGLHATGRPVPRPAAATHKGAGAEGVKGGGRRPRAGGRREIHEASASALPFPNDTSTCATMAGLLGSLPDPVAALSEMRRVLEPGGRIVIMGTDPELWGTPAAPETIASRRRSTDSEQLKAIGRRAGFDQVRVARRDPEPFAREAGVPEEHIALCSGKGGGSRSLLTCKA
jgi:SAM-dependent methyltransferase